MKHHLAILSPDWIELILSGDKTIESRFSKVRCAPFGKVNTGDVVFMKESCGLVKGAFRVGKVQTFENLTEEQVTYIDGNYHFEIFGQGVHHWSHREKWYASKHATLIHIAEKLEYNTPFAIHKRDPRAWVVYDHISEFTKTFVDADLRKPSWWLQNIGFHPNLYRV